VPRFRRSSTVDCEDPQLANAIRGQLDVDGNVAFHGVIGMLGSNAKDRNGAQQSRLPSQQLLAFRFPEQCRTAGAWISEELGSQFGQ
jgi:hypothetical protein